MIPCTENSRKCQLTYRDTKETWGAEGGEGLWRGGGAGLQRECGRAGDGGCARFSRWGGQRGWLVKSLVHV